VRPDNFHFLRRIRVLTYVTQPFQIFLSYYNESLVRDETSNRIVSFGAVAKILGGLEPNYGSSSPKVMFYSARGPDPEDNTLANADILKPNLIAPGSSIWGAWSSLGLDSAEFTGNFTVYLAFHLKLKFTYSRVKSIKPINCMCFHFFNHFFLTLLGLHICIQ
jgi:hypothetical protein